MSDRTPNRVSPRVGKGVPTGGQFAASAHAEADVSLAGSQVSQASQVPEPSTPEQIELAQRLDAYERLKDFGVVGTCTTLVWPEEPNEDGTFDVDLDVVWDERGNEVETIGGHGAEPAGYLDEGATGGFRTAYDIWRENPDNAATAIDLNKMQDWYADYHRAAAFETLDRLAPVGENGRRWVENESDFWAADKARLEAQTLTPFVDLAPGDRFVKERYKGGYAEYEVAGAPFDVKDRFGRDMKAIEIKDHSGGCLAIYHYGAAGIARKVEKPAHLRVDPANIPTEHDLNEAWGV